MHIEYHSDVTTPDTAPPVQLSYAPGARSRRRKWVRVIVIALALIALPLLMQRVYMPVRDKFTFLYHQSRCMTFAAAPVTVAYTEDRATVERLTGVHSISGRGTVAGPGWAALINSGKPVAYYLAPPSLRALEETRDVNLPQGIGAVFLHGRTSRGGAERLVVVKVDLMRKYGAYPRTGFFDQLLLASAMRPAGLVSGPSVTRSSWRPPSIPAWGTLTLLAGQPDPSDASHFTIDYQTPAGKGTIDGWLQPDDTVKFEAHDGPLARSFSTTH